MLGNTVVSEPESSVALTVAVGVAVAVALDITSSPVGLSSKRSAPPRSSPPEIVPSKVIARGIIVKGPNLTAIVPARIIVEALLTPTIIASKIIPRGVVVLGERGRREDQRGKRYLVTSRGIVEGSPCPVGYGRLPSLALTLA